MWAPRRETFPPWVSLPRPGEVQSRFVLCSLRPTEACRTYARETMEDPIKSQTGPAASEDAPPASAADPQIPVDFEKSASTPPPPAKVDPYVGKTIDGR